MSTTVNITINTTINITINTTINNTTIIISNITQAFLAPMSAVVFCSFPNFWILEYYVPFHFLNKSYSRFIDSINRSVYACQGIHILGTFLIAATWYNFLGGFHVNL